MLKDKLTESISSAYLKMNGIEINESANDYEAEHKSILKKLHKAHPELGLDKAEHVEKYKGHNTETHIYAVDHEDSSSHVHNKLLPNLSTRVEIRHGVHNGKSFTDGQVRHSWGHMHNEHVANHSTFDKHEDGSLHVHHYDENNQRVTTKH
jgi:hypothetical protein